MYSLNKKIIFTTCLVLLFHPLVYASDQAIDAAMDDDAAGLAVVAQGGEMSVQVQSIGDERPRRIVVDIPTIRSKLLRPTSESIIQMSFSEDFIFPSEECAKLAATMCTLINCSIGITDYISKIDFDDVWNQAQVVTLGEIANSLKQFFNSDSRPAIESGSDSSLSATNLLREVKVAGQEFNRVIMDLISQIMNLINDPSDDFDTFIVSFAEEITISEEWKHVLNTIIEQTRTLRISFQEAEGMDDDQKAIALAIAVKKIIGEATGNPNIAKAIGLGTDMAIPTAVNPKTGLPSSPRFVPKSKNPIRRLVLIGIGALVVVLIIMYIIHILTKKKRKKKIVQSEEDEEMPSWLPA